MSANTDTIVNFYDNYVPSLKDGQYTITLSQTIAGDAGLTTPPQVPTAAQSFIVNGPRFSLPPSDVNHVYPANGSTGQFAGTLPQIVLNEQALPWERNLTQNPSIPWVALLVFSQEELLGPHPSPPPGSQQNPTMSSNRLLNDVLNPGTGMLGPSLTLEANEDASTIYCNAIDIPVATFNALLPSLSDATFLAHTRQVSLANKAIVPGQTGFFSAVMANRFVMPPAPVSGSTVTVNTNIAHLVSLEGFEQYIQQDGPPSVPVSFTAVRMVSLYSWTFNVQDQPAQDFSVLMNNLISDSSVEGTGLLLTMPLPDPAVAPPSSETTSVLARLKDGYIPLNYQMQSGDQSFAWYRGPLSAVPVQRFLEENTAPPANPATPFTTADAMIFDSKTGIFDQSYAVAFQTGRSLALANKAFATNLIRWRKNCYGMVDLLMEYMTSPVYASKMLADGLINSSNQLTATGVADLAQLLNNDVVTAAFVDLSATGLYKSIADSIGQQAGFPAKGNTVLDESAVGTVPSELSALMQQPIIVNLLQHLSGFSNMGTLSQPIQLGATSIDLNAAILEDLSAGNSLVLYSPDGSTTALVTLSADMPEKSITLSINAYTGKMLPANSVVMVQEPDQSAQAVVSWLANTALLYNVPFNNLVANPHMLPQESIRFFYLDQNWTDALLDGALSIGIQSSRDTVFGQLMRNALYGAVQESMAQVRDGLLGVAAQGHVPAVTKPSGFLLRSQNISNWPGLQIMATSATGNLMKPLRLDTVAGDVLLAIYPDIPTQITFTQPYEGLIFGIEDIVHTNQQGINLRYIPGANGYTASNIGETTGNAILSTSIDNSLRQGYTPAALNIGGPNGLVSILEKQLGVPNLTPASFAVEMVVVPEQMVFVPPPAS